jgi:ApbE superfamily uncharacterized protein (UPF0280 family)
VNGPVAARTRDGDRYHFQHGPIDLIISIDGDGGAAATAYEAAWRRFETILDELVTELPRLRRPLDGEPFTGSTARRMADAVARFPGQFVTPMAAVAGSVADEVCAAIVASGDGALDRVAVNNGGDIAFHLADGASYDIGLVPIPDRPALLGTATISHDDPVRGVATSGRHGRSHSLGIADAVTVLAASAAVADVAATLIANSVDLPEHPSIERAPATDLDDDSDLGDRLVTVSVGELTGPETAIALAAGAGTAQRMRESGSIVAAVLCLGDEVVTVGTPSTGVALP